MKKIGGYIAIGCIIAIIGLLFSDICGDFFNGMDYGSGCVLGMGMYLCVVVVTCTGIVISKISPKQNENAADDEKPYNLKW